MRRVMATAGRTVFFSSLTVAAALASLLVFPQRFLYSMGLGGALVAMLRGADLADRAARRADPARHAGQLALAALPAAPRRGRDAARRAGLLVPALALRHAPAAADRDGSAALPDRHRHPLPRDQVQHRRPQRAARGGERPPGLRHRQRGVPALPRGADLARGRGGDPQADRRRCGSRVRAHRGHRRGASAPAAARGPHGDPGGLGEPVRLRGRARRPWSGCASSTSPGGPGAGRRRHGRLRRLPGQPRAPRCRSRWRS